MSDPATARAHAWYRRTGHCYGCGNPGNYCLCRTPCECRDLHPVGSGLDAEASEVFGEPPSEQDVLWEQT